MEFVKSVTKKESFWKYLVILVTIILYCLFLVIYVNASYPMVGHDYDEFISTLLDTYLYIRNNGFSIQWFTPSFGGGLPAFYNSQHLQYSIPQFLMLIFNPWVSVLISLLIFTIIGYWAFYRLGRDIFHWGWKTSVLGATLFTINGYYIEHAAAGHVSQQAFPLVSVFIYVLLSPSIKPRIGGGIIGLCAAFMLYINGYFPLLIIGLTFLLLIPMLLILLPQIINIKKIIKTGVIGLVLGLSVSAGKLYAVYSFMRYFPRFISHQYYLNFTDSFRGLVGQILGIMFFVPFAKIQQGDASKALVYLDSYLSEMHGIWEKDTSISPVLLILCFLGVLWVIMNMYKVFAEPRFRKSQGVGIILLFLSVWFAFEVISTRGGFYDFFHSLPVFSSLHLNFRFATAFLFPAAIFGGIAFERITSSLSSKFRSMLFLILNFLALAFVWAYFSLPPEIQVRTTNIDVAIQTYQLVREGENLTIDKIKMTKDEISLFMNRASNLYPQEPVFGYKLNAEKFPSELTEGSVYQVSDGYLNFNNPIGFVYPEETGVEAFDRFRVEDEDVLRDFLARKEVDWPIPHTQKALNVFSLIVFIGVLGFLGHQGINVILKRRFRRRGGTF